jgi:hypothetical protein
LFNDEIIDARGLLWVPPLRVTIKRSAEE